MAEFIHFEAEHSSDENVENEPDISDHDSFINGESENEEEYSFRNVQVDLERANREAYERGLERIQDCDEYSNLCTDSDDDIIPLDEFEKSDKLIKEFKNGLLPKVETIEQKIVHNEFARVILYAVKNLITNKTEICDILELKQESILNEILEKFSSQKLHFTLDLQEFNRISYQINNILIEYNYFLRVFEQKNKYRQFYVKKPEKQNQIKQLSRCLIEKYNGFQVVKIDFSKKESQKFEPIDTIYIPTKNPEVLPECYYTLDISKAYTSVYSHGLKQKRAFKLYECYYCRKFFIQKNKHEKHLSVCSGKPGIVYNFCIQNLVSFEDNFGSKGDLPFSIYFDFETTSPTDANWVNPEEKKIIVMYYVIVVAFHLSLNLDRILIQRSYCHPQTEMISINYLTREQIQYRSVELIKQLYDQAIHVSKRNCKNTLAQMFCIEIAFVKKTLLSWFNKKFTARFKELTNDQKIHYKRQNPIDYQNRKCVICKMPLKVSPTNPKTEDEQMTYGDFIIRYEYKFLKNIYTQKQLEWSEDLISLEAFYEAFQKFIHISIDLISLLSEYTKTHMLDISMEVSNFLELNFADCDIHSIKNHIMQTEIKNALASSYGKIPKFNLKIYAYLYDELVCFPPQSQYDSVTTKKFFMHVHNLIKMKIHIHHSHVTGKINGYAHDFCNTRLIECEKPEIPCFAHNLFGFDFLYFVKGFSATAWCSKELDVGGNNLTHVNYASLRREIKFIDTLKFYQRSLAELTSTIEESEIIKARKQMENFFNNHSYFSKIWPFIPAHQKEKILKITCEGKGVIPYEMVTGMESFFLQPENDFCRKTEFHN